MLQPTTAAAAEAFDSAVREQVLRLVPKPRTTVLTSEKAAAALAAIDRGDYAKAKKLTEDAVAPVRSATWGSYPLNEFMPGIVNYADDNVFPKLSQWVSRDSNSAIPYLARAQNYLNLGWKIRGANYAAWARADHLTKFLEYMDLARADILKSIERNGNIPYSYFLWLTVERAHGSTNAVEAAFRQGVGRFPEYYPLYKVRLGTLAPKWGRQHRRDVCICGALR